MNNTVDTSVDIVKKIFIGVVICVLVVAFTTGLVIADRVGKFKCKELTGSAVKVLTLGTGYSINDTVRVDGVLYVIMDK